ncbi:MAG: FAD:protein FMN transferase [Clostridium sp.]|nr:MAG: FAD:protein FMN transferase [Clostridium sp.]
MDTIVNVKLEATNEATANVHFTEIENIYEKYNNLADDYMSHSDIKSVYDINTNRTEVVADELIELLNYAISINKETNGYYEPLIGNISHLWKDYVLNVKKSLKMVTLIFVLQSLDKELNNIKESKKL